MSATQAPTLLSLKLTVTKNVTAAAAVEHQVAYSPSFTISSSSPVSAQTMKENKSVGTATRYLQHTTSPGRYRLNAWSWLTLLLCYMVLLKYGGGLHVPCHDVCVGIS